jgi:hypothetical protein
LNRRESHTGGGIRVSLSKLLADCIDADKVERSENDNAFDGIFCCDVAEPVSIGLSLQNFIVGMSLATSSIGVCGDEEENLVNNWAYFDS